MKGRFTLFQWKFGSVSVTRKGTEMKLRKAYYCVWADGTKWLGWEPEWVSACRRAVRDPHAPAVRMETVMILR